MTIGSEGLYSGEGRKKEKKKKKEMWQEERERERARNTRHIYKKNEPGRSSVLEHRKRSDLLVWVSS